MYAFSRDESLLLFMDGFGLTRMSQPNAAKRDKGVWQLKTDPKIMGSEACGLVSVSADGEAAATYEDLWDKSVLWALPELRASKRFDRFRESGATIHPEGTHYLVLEHELRIEPLVRTVLLPMRLDKPKPKARSKAKTLSLEGGLELAPWRVGGDTPAQPFATLRLADDGTLLAHHGGQLVRGTLSGTSLDIEWRRALQVPEGARVSVHGDAKRTVVMVHEGRSWRIAERVGERERELVIESVGVPAIGGRFLAWQATPTLVVRHDLDADTREEFSLELPEDARVTELPSAGAGTLFVGAQGRLLVLLRHRESLVDLVARVEIDRKLPAKQLELRQAVLERARPYLDAALGVGATIELGRIELDDKHHSVSVTHRIGGPSTLLGAMLAASAQSVWSGASFPGGWRMSGYGSHGGIGCDETIDVPALVRAQALLAAAGSGFAGTLGFWDDHFDRHEEGLEPATVAWLARVLMILSEHGAHAEIDGEAIARMPPPSAAEVSAALAHYPEHAEELDFRASRLVGRIFNELLGADAAPLWVHLYLDAEWSNRGTPYYDLASSAIEPLLERHPETARAFREWIAAHPEPSDDLRWYVEQLGETLTRYP